MYHIFYTLQCTDSQRCTIFENDLICTHIMCIVTHIKILLTCDYECNYRDYDL